MVFPPAHRRWLKVESRGVWKPDKKVFRNTRPPRVVLLLEGIMPIADNAESPPQSNPVSSLPVRWLESYGDSLYGYALRRVRRPEVAEDLVQETLLAGVQRYSSFSNRSTVKTWLTAILRNKIADHLRARYQNENIDTSSLDDDAMFNRRGKWKVAVPRWKGDPRHLAELAELRGVLDGCMARLPVRMAHLFLSRAVDQISTAELCAQLQITPENAWMLLHRARSRLRHCVATRWFKRFPPEVDFNASRPQTAEPELQACNATDLPRPGPTTG